MGFIINDTITISAFDLQITGAYATIMWNTEVKKETVIANTSYTYKVSGTVILYFNKNTYDNELGSPLHSYTIEASLGTTPLTTPNFDRDLVPVLYTAAKAQYTSCTDA